MMNIINNQQIKNDCGEVKAIEFVDWIISLTATEGHVSRLKF